MESLDRIDRRILEILQRDNRLPNVELAERVGLSPPACSRRVARLRETGVIRGDVSILDPQKVGKTVKVMIAVTLDDRSKTAAEVFQRKMLEREEVQHCYMIAGSIDFFVLAVLADVEAYAEFGSEVFGGDANIRNYESWFVLSQVKSETRVPIRV